MGDREQFWQAHIDACRVSGDTQKTYCERHGIGSKSFRRWRSRLSGAASMAAVESEPHRGGVRGGAEKVFSPSLSSFPGRVQRVDLFTNPRCRRTWTPEQKQQIVMDALRSGLSIERFARMSGLAPSVVHRWKQDLTVYVGHGQDPAKPSTAAPTFASVHVAPVPSRPASRTPSDAIEAPTHDTVEVILTNGRRVRLHAQMDAKALHNLLAVLECGP